MKRFGIAGIPLTSKGRTLLDSIADVHFLGLTSLEVQLLRVNVEQVPSMEHSGMFPRDVEDSIVVNVLRPDENGNYVSIGTDSIIEEEDIVEKLFWNMARNYDEILDAGELSRELDVELSLHAPYYMDLLGDDDISTRSYEHLKWSMVIAKGMGAKRIITHTGFYHKGKKESLRRAKDIYSTLGNEFPVEKGFPYIGVETSGKSEIFGTVEELISIARRVKEVEPIMNLPHIHSLSNGGLIELKNFEEMVNTFKKFAKNELYVEYAGVSYRSGNEVKIMPIKYGDLKFETFSELLVEDEDDYNIISFSPLLEHDAQYMELIFLRSLSRKLQRLETLRKRAKKVETVTREYNIKKGRKVDNDTIKEACNDIFGNAKVASSGHIISKTPGLNKIEAFTDGKKLYVTTESSPNRSDYANAVKLYNEFIERITGTTSKERRKRLQKKR